MSRSNPTTTSKNPATRFLEWNGGTGIVTYYDKETKTNIEVPKPFVFIVLDELSSIRGWHESSKSGISSNEVRATNTDILRVKAFKGGPIAEGLYGAIKDRVKSAGGHFTANVYCAIKDATGALVIAQVQFAGAALNAWIEYRNVAKDEIYKGAIAITGAKEDKKGAVKFFTPVFEAKAVTEETNKKATDLDVIVQAHLAVYLNAAPVAQAKVEEIATKVEEQKPEEVKKEIVEATEHIGPVDDLPF